MWLILLLLLGCAGGSSSDPPPPTPPPKLTTIQLNGMFATGGTFAGTLSYDPTAMPLVSNVRHLMPNAVFAVSSFVVTVKPALDGLPAFVTFSSIVPGDTLEFCVGDCVFGGPSDTNLIFSDGKDQLQLTFQPDWGPPVLSSSKFSWNFDGQFFQGFMIVTSDQATVS